MYRIFSEAIVNARLNDEVGQEQITGIPVLKIRVNKGKASKQFYYRKY